MFIYFIYQEEIFWNTDLKTEIFLHVVMIKKILRRNIYLTTTSITYI